jgi:hypothetical protein
VTNEEVAMVRHYKRKTPRPLLSVGQRVAAAAELNANGKSTRQIAAELGVSAGTISRDLRNHELSQPGLMTEAHFQASVISVCKLFGVALFHPYYSERSTPGWPDLALCGTRGFILRELKTEVGKLTADQEKWGSMLRQAGMNWDVWRPGDLQSGRIQRELQAIR